MQHKVAYTAYSLNPNEVSMWFSQSRSLVVESIPPINVITSQPTRVAHQLHWLQYSGCTVQHAAM